MDPPFALKRKYKQNGKKQNELNDKDGDETTTNKVKLIGSKFSPHKRKYFYRGNRNKINRIFNKKKQSVILQMVPKMKLLGYHLTLKICRG